MRYLVDTSVWSLSLRRAVKSDSKEVQVLERLLKEEEGVYLTGFILQEILQGIKHVEQFQKIKDALSCLPLLIPSADDHIFAAEIFNKCMSKGVIASTIDFLITSLAIRNEFALLTTDKDFSHIARHTDLKLAC